MMKETFRNDGIFYEMCKKLSHKMSVWLRESTDECARSGKKVNVFLNYQVMDKVKLIQRVMNRLIYGLNKDNGSEIHIRGGSNDAPTPAATLARFINISKDPSKTTMPLKEKIGNIFFRANEMS